MCAKNKSWRLREHNGVSSWCFRKRFAVLSAFTRGDHTTWRTLQNLNQELRYICKRFTRTPTRKWRQPPTPLQSIFWDTSKKLSITEPQRCCIVLVLFVIWLKEMILPTRKWGKRLADRSSVVILVHEQNNSNRKTMTEFPYRMRDKIDTPSKNESSCSCYEH